MGRVEEMKMIKIQYIYVRNSQNFQVNREMSFTMFECLDNLDTESICGEHREAQMVILYWIDRWYLLE